jgi:zinc/manganese transport system ATP-binding protein
MAACFDGDTTCNSYMAGSDLGEYAIYTMVKSEMVTLNNLTISYQSHPALHHLSGGFSTGSLTAVMGPNGAGKSTLLKSLAQLIPPDKAASNRGDNPALKINVPRHRIGYLSQTSELDKTFPISVLNCVALGCWNSAGAWSAVTAPMRNAIGNAIHAVGLQGFEDRSIGSLSGGQFQRVLFARLLVQDPDLILLDEPLNGIDSATSAVLMAIVLQWHQLGRTVIAALHDKTLVQNHFPSTLLLARELVAWGKTAEVLSAANLGRALGMAEAWDESAAVCNVSGTTFTQSLRPA